MTIAATPHGSAEGTIPTRTRALVRGLGPVIFTLVVALVVGSGLAFRDRGYLSPEQGLGYAFGILGSLLMVLLLGYPLRKRRPQAKHLGSVSGWFRFHMALGVIGPLLILLHANFQLGSQNSAVALLSMLLVVTSGVIGRYMYRRVHRGLYGRRLTLDELVRSTQSEGRRITDRVPMPPHLRGAVQELESGALTRASGLGDAVARGLRVSVSSRRLCRELRRCATLAVVTDARWETLERRQRKAMLREIRDSTTEYTVALRRVVAFSIYERLLSLWHTLHVPLAVLLLITTVVHVIAVHAY
jgi:hypothetical protein